MATQNGSGSPSTRTIPAAPSTTARRPASREKKRGGGSFWLYAFFFVVIVGCIVAFVLVRRSHAEANLKSATQKMAVPTVLIVHPEIGTPDVHLVLPGTVQAQIESSVYAQVTGYIKRWLVDIGAPVKEGQLLAEIETPVTDQQLMLSKANLGQAQANLALAQITAKRYNNLRASNAVSQQDVDNQNGNVAVQQASVDAAEASVHSIEQTLAFKQVKAPFDGVITARRVDNGDLVTAGGGVSVGIGNAQGSATPGSSSTELFRVAQTKTLRIYVNVPENYSAEVVPGVTASIEMASSPGQNVTGKLVRTSEAIDPNSLTLLAEVDVDNAENKLLPGGYAQVHFDLKEAHPPLVLPGNTLIFRAQGTQVGVVDQNNVVHLKDIKIGRDFGTKLEVIDGIEKDDAVILNPSDSLAEGARVQVDTQSDEKKP